MTTSTSPESTSRRGLRRTRMLLAAMTLSAAAVLTPAGLASAATAPAPATPPQVSGGLNDGNLHPGDFGWGQVSGFDCSKTVKITFLGINYSANPCVAPGIYPVFQFSVPASTKPGTYLMRATNSLGQQADNYTYIAPISPSATPSSYYSPVGTTITINARGFQSGETVKLYVNGKATSITAIAKQPAGRYFALTSQATLNYTLPKSLKGTTATFELRGLTSKTKTSFTVSVAG